MQAEKRRKTGKNYGERKHLIEGTFIKDSAKESPGKQEEKQEGAGFGNLKSCQFKAGEVVNSIHL